MDSTSDTSTHAVSSASCKIVGIAFFIRTARTSAVEWLTLLLRIQEAQGSVLGLETGYPG